MREIKFRAWNKEMKQMLPVGDVAFKRKSAWGEDNLAGAVVVLPTGHDQFYDSERIELMQFTGLLDKNGKEIYEGDIVLYPDTFTDKVDVGIGQMPVAQTQENSFAPVIFKDYAFGLEVEKGGESLDGGFNTFDYIVNEYGFESEDFEVIGNIYENPELLNPKGE